MRLASLLRHLPDTLSPVRSRPRYTLHDRERAAMEHRLQEAHERQAFHLHYQPLVSLSDGRLAGVEALLRWDSEVGKIIPEHFVPVLEDTGLIVPVGAWVLQEACRQAAQWAGEFPSSEQLVAVNVSPVQLEDPGFVTAVTEALHASGLPADRLCLDLTSTSSIADVPAAWAQLRELKMFGVRIAIDDFGTAHSSLSFVKSFSVDILKIDRSFIAGLGRSPEDDAIVAAVVYLGRALGLDTVAEGVETAEQVAALERLGCDQAQGCHFVPPGPPSAVAELLRRVEEEASASN